MATTVSRETQDRLDRYAALLEKWQAKINLVAPDTLADAQVRHFQDSLQLLAYLGPRACPGDPQNEMGLRTKSAGLKIADLGTGAGFPGLALAIARPDLDVHLVESDAKKCEFLKTVSRETGAPVTIHNSRIEAVPPFPVDILTARALASLDKLIVYALPFIAQNPDIQLIFLKGENWTGEVAAARQTYSFDLQDYPSITHPKARILILTNIRSLS